jgi:SET domain-containing protein
MHKTKKFLLDHLNNDLYCRLDVSPIAGVGVFAIRPIAKGINPLKSWLPTEEVDIKWEEIKKLPATVRKQVEMFCYYDKKKVSVPVIGLNAMNMSIYLNHSKTPNLKFRKNGKLIALRAIKKDEELTIDYDESFGEVHTFED